MAPPAPKGGRRGSLTPLGLRDAPYRGEHDVSAAQRPTPPQTWPACVAWFRDAWEASLPNRLHTSGVEADSALGSPRMAGAMHARIDHASANGWGLTGHHRDGSPRGVGADGLTRDPFLFYLERMLRSSNAHEHLGALALVRWAYMGWDVEAAAQETFLGQHANPETWGIYVVSFRALMERTIRTLALRCQQEPERFPVCKDCRKRDCICGQRSESQVRAEEAG